MSTLCHPVIIRPSVAGYRRPSECRVYAAAECARPRCTLNAFSIPKGLRLKTQGCEQRATLGLNPTISTNPNGVAALRQQLTCGRFGHNPVGVDNIRQTLPRVARCSQPWALRQNP